MRTVYDVKRAFDLETMMNIMLDAQASKKDRAKAETKIKRRNKWRDLFPILK